MGLTIPQMALMSRLLDEALPLDTDGRRRWLDALAPERQGLAGVLRAALLPAAADERVAGLLNAGAKIDLERFAGGASAGEPVGPYRLIRLLGKGGMAEVWLAQRADGAFTRDVALKLPLLSQWRNDLASRFARERDILAALEHPNIARLYDAGVSANGVPYLAMEYVAGASLTTWCDAHQLGIRERLELFRQVLDAVQYAHERQVIHRDIKPSNILVTDSGQVRLLDFGVAKLLAKEHEQTNLTLRYGRVLTPDYASPELLRGERISANTDVYALGVVLYELLCGSRPYSLDAGGSGARLEEAINATVVKRPSAQVAPGAGRNRGTTQQKLLHRLQGDLDEIVLKAVAKAPADRYDSAGALAQDLQCSLRGEPVAARSDRFSYRYRKALQRHGTLITTAAAAVVLVVVALGYALMRTQPAAAPPAVNVAPAIHDTVAVTAQDKSIAVLPFMDLSEKQDQQYFSDGLSEQLIDHLVHHADLKVIARTSSFQFRGKNEDVRSIARQLGVSHVLEGSVRKAGTQLRITAQLIRASDGVDLWSQTYDRELVDIFKVQDEIGAKVSDALHVALQNGHAVGGPEPNVEAYNLVLEGNYFKARQTVGDVQKAVELYRRAIAINPDYALAWARLGSAYLNEAVVSRLPSQAKNKRILDALNRAIRLDPNMVWAYYTRAGFEWDVTWNWLAAQADDERIQQIDPRFELLPSAFGDVALTFGDLDKAIEWYRADRERNPLDPRAMDSLSIALCAANRLQECLQLRLDLLQLHPDFGGINGSVSLAYLYLGQFSAALAALQNETNEEYRLAGLSITQSALGNRAESDAALNSLIGKYGSSEAYEIAQVHAYRGEIDEAFRWLDIGYQKHDAAMLAVKTDPLLHSLHGDPRFQGLLNRMGLANPIRPHSLGLRGRESISPSQSL